MKRSPAAALLAFFAVVAILAMSLGAGRAAMADDPTPAASCTDEPGVALTCVLPYPAPLTETVTETVPVPGPTVTQTVTATATTTVTASPSPSATPSPTPTVTPSPTPTVTPSSSTPTPTPTPTATPTVVPGAWPGPGNTGVPAGTVLRLVKRGDSGPGWNVDTGTNATFTINKAGTVIDGFDIPFVVRAVANNITIKNSRIRAGGYYTIKNFDPPTWYSGLTIMDTEVDGLNDLSVPGISIPAGANFTLLRLNVHGFGSSGPRLGTGTLLQDSWIHGFVCAPGEHSAGSSANSGGGNIRVIHNYIDISTGKDGCASAALALYPADGGPFDGVDITGNYFDGGAYCLYTGQNQPGVKNVRVTNNVFGRTYYPRCGQFGPVTQAVNGANGNTFTGNKFSDGAPIN